MGDFLPTRFSEVSDIREVHGWSHGKDFLDKRLSSYPQGEGLVSVYLSRVVIVVVIGRVRIHFLEGCVADPGQER